MKNLFKFSFLVLMFSCNMTNNSLGQNKDRTIDSVLTKQILLTNNATFNNGVRVRGASSFLINHQDSIYAVTALHLIEPLLTKDVPNNFIQWRVYPRHCANVTDTVNISCSTVRYDKAVNDILLFKVESSYKGIVPLTPKFKMPNLNDTVYLVGCPYGERTCTQNVYKAIAVEYGKTKATIIFEFFDKKVNLMGFSGAPILDKKGNVIAVLVSGAEVEGKKYIIGTSIKEIIKML